MKPGTKAYFRSLLKSEGLRSTDDDVIYVGNVYYYDLSWPVLDWMFMPSYVAWHSGWYWGY